MGGADEYRGDRDSKDLALSRVFVHFDQIPEPGQGF